MCSNIIHTNTHIYATENKSKNNNCLERNIQSLSNLNIISCHHSTKRLVASRLSNYYDTIQDIFSFMLPLSPLLSEIDINSNK